MCLCLCVNKCRPELNINIKWLYLYCWKEEFVYVLLFMKMKWLIICICWWMCVVYLWVIELIISFFEVRALDNEKVNDRQTRTLAYRAVWFSKSKATIKFVEPSGRINLRNNGDRIEKQNCQDLCRHYIFLWQIMWLDQTGRSWDSYINNYPNCIPFGQRKCTHTNLRASYYEHLNVINLIYRQMWGNASRSTLPNVTQIAHERYVSDFGSFLWLQDSTGRHISP